MTRSLKLVLVLALAVSCARVSAEQLPPLELMPVGEVRAGMTGEGRTVFSGSAIESFDARILGVLKKIRPKGDLILAELSGGPLAKTGLISGMSGSPVYVDGKLIGAVAYGWSFGKDAIAGITPAEEMLSVMAGGGTAARVPEHASVPVPLREVLHLRGREFESVLFSRSPPGSSPGDSRSMVFVPIATPLMVSGLDASMIADLERELGPVGLVPVQSGGSAELDAAARSLEAGGVMGVVLASGDVEMAGVGTVTWRRGDEVVGFGHPMLFGGELEVPMVGGSVHTVIASRMMSFKLTSVTGTLGTIVQDRQKGIGGVVGKLPQMVPVAVTVRKGGRIVVDDSFEVVDHPLLTPRIAVTLMSNSVLSAGKGFGGVTMRAKLSARVTSSTGKRRLRMEESFYSPESPLAPVSALARPLAWLFSNRFEPVTLEDVKLDVVMDESRRTAAITSVRAERSRVEPGGVLKLRVRLEPYGASPVDVPVSIAIPVDAREGMAQVTVCGGVRSRALERARVPGKFVPADLDQLIGLLEAEDRSTEIVVRVSLRRKGLTVRGEEVPSLPDSVLAIMGNSADTDAGYARAEVKEKQKTEWVVSGMKRLRIAIRKETTGGRAN